MRIVALDQSLTATAAVMFELLPDDRIAVKEVKHFKPKNSGIYRLLSIQDWINDIINHYKPDLLCRELHNQVQFGAAKQLQSLGGMIDIIAYSNGLLDDKGYAMIPVTTWKKFITGKGNLKKDTAYLVHINRSLKASNLLHLPSMEDFVDDNIADAICIGITGYAAKKLASEQSLNVSKQSIIDLRKSLNVIFGYGE